MTDPMTVGEIKNALVISTTDVAHERVHYFKIVIVVVSVVSLVYVYKREQFTVQNIQNYVLVYFLNRLVFLLIQTMEY